jgi:hypothetical protein
LGDFAHEFDERFAVCATDIVFNRGQVVFYARGGGLGFVFGHGALRVVA